MSLAPDRHVELAAAKVSPAPADDPRALHHHHPDKPRVWKSLLSRSGPVIRLLYDERGQDLVEYAFILALVGLGAFAAISGMAGKLRNALNVVGSNLISST